MLLVDRALMVDAVLDPSCDDWDLIGEGGAHIVFAYKGRKEEFVSLLHGPLAFLFFVERHGFAYLKDNLPVLPTSTINYSEI